ncbi:MAG: sarcosine oxidase subunit gamma [Geminicoccaceae bacterium]
MLYDRSDIALAVSQGMTSPGRLSGGLEISVLDKRARYSLRAKPAAADHVRKLTGLPLPSGINQSAEEKTIRLHCLGPDEWLLVADNGDDLQARFAIDPKKASATPFSLVDVSHRHVAIEVTGANAANAIRTGCPLDLDPDAFPVGKVTRTLFERTEIILFRRAPDHFDIEVWRSFAPYLLALLKKAAEHC